MSGYKVDIDNVKVEKKPGGSITDTKLISGMVLDKEVVHSGDAQEDRRSQDRADQLGPRDREDRVLAEIRINDPARCSSSWTRRPTS